jgi:hypothetical protein
MAKQNRSTLKKYFRNGNLPSEQQFSHLVDSMLNIMDEGFDKSPDEGLKVNQLTDSGKLISFYKDFEMLRPRFFVRVDQKDNLILGSEKDQNVLFRSEGRENSKVKVGINTDEPESELDVGGVIRAEGRIGVVSEVDKRELEVPANGAWHDITDTLTGCQAFEIMAGVGGRKKEGKYALMHAIALNTYNPRGLLFDFLSLKKRIKYHHAYYRSRSDKLKLRWHGDEGHTYSLQLKSNSNYGDGIQIKYYITKLWFDEVMEESRPPQQQG